MAQDGITSSETLTIKDGMSREGFILWILEPHAVGPDGKKMARWFKFTSLAGEDFTLTLFVASFAANSQITMIRGQIRDKITTDSGKVYDNRRPMEFEGYYDTNLRSGKLNLNTSF